MYQCYFCCYLKMKLIIYFPNDKRRYLPTNNQERTSCHQTLAWCDGWCQRPRVKIKVSKYCACRRETSPRPAHTWPTDKPTNPLIFYFTLIYKDLRQYWSIYYGTVSACNYFIINIISMDDASRCCSLSGLFWSICAKWVNWLVQVLFWHEWL